MCHSPVEQKWNSMSAIIEQQGAGEVFEEWGGVGEKSGENEKLGID